MHEDCRTGFVGGGQEGTPSELGPGSTGRRCSTSKIELSVIQIPLHNDE